MSRPSRRTGRANQFGLEWPMTVHGTECWSMRDISLAMGRRPQWFAERLYEGWSVEKVMAQPRLEEEDKAASCYELAMKAMPASTTSPDCSEAHLL